MARDNKNGRTPLRKVLLSNLMFRVQKGLLFRELPPTMKTTTTTQGGMQPI